MGVLALPVQIIENIEHLVGIGFDPHRPYQDLLLYLLVADLRGSLREHYAHANLRRLHQTTLLFASLKAELCACRHSDIHRGGDISMAQ
jgi:hypothetical protein